jgi:hypothetical protein
MDWNWLNPEGARRIVNYLSESFRRLALSIRVQRFLLAALNIDRLDAQIKRE